MKAIKQLIAPVIVALLVATAANAALWQWSKTASSNATADPTINFSEGMSPSSVNDSARAMMARIAGWRDDLSGLLVTAGTSTAYTVVTNQGLNATPENGQAIAATMSATNGAAPTLAADGGTAYPIQTAAGTAVTAGSLISGTPYTFKFSSSASAWVLHGFYGNPYNIPLGSYTDSSYGTVPNSNYVLPAGQCISRSTYAAYFALVADAYGACDGVTTFAVPDLRGRVRAAIDNLNGSAAGRMTVASTGCGVAFTTLGAVCGSQSTTLLTANLPAYTPGGTISVSLSGVTAITNGVVGFVPGGAGLGGLGNQLNNASLINPTAFPLSGTATATWSGTAQGGTSTPFSSVQPTIGVAVFLRVL